MVKQKALIVIAMSMAVVYLVQAFLWAGESAATAGHTAHQDPRTTVPTVARPEANARLYDVAFLCIGDWGQPLPVTHRVAAAMAHFARLHSVDFVVSAGDNFYPDGVDSSTKDRFRTHFEEVFAAPELQHIPWYMSLGNHDQTRGTALQVRYTNRSRRWRMPSPFYTAVVASQTNPSFIELFVLDHYNMLNGKYTVFTSQLNWLEARLAASTAHWKVVVDHRPVFSGGNLHGSSPRLQAKLVPLLHRYGVQLVLSGDDHILEILSWEGISYVVSGGGTWLHGHKAIPQTLFGAAVNGFTLHRANRTHLVSSLVDEHRTVLFESVQAWNHGG
eukprot:TRINITY_DN28101_c0_g1_i1.p2 TRINITY_DN28101_c0_g1~~TRINITY_DN28101_c0_g1_i1.p2  ORF type:complete len:331 (+),score=47.56 TRINITY_DN28101_c0_g1_i1:40-1032(+)